jgi:hypothetical protein
VLIIVAKMAAAGAEVLFTAGQAFFTVPLWFHDGPSDPGGWSDAQMGYYRTSGNAKYSTVPFHSAPDGVATVRREVTTFEIG